VPYGRAAATIADAIGTDKATVLHTLRAMESRGRIKIEWGKQGQGHCSKFWMGDGEEKVHACTFMKHAKGAEKGASVTLKGAPVLQNYIKNHLNPERDAKVPERADYFAELQQIWVRPWPDDEAADRRASIAAC
jgi:hypothetical protein